MSGRNNAEINIVENYAKEQGLWESDNIEFTENVSLDMSTIVPTISGPKRPQDKVFLKLMELNLKLEMVPYSLQQ